MLGRTFWLLIVLMHFVLPAFADPEIIENPQESQEFINIDIEPGVTSVGCNKDDLFGLLSGSIEFEANWTALNFQCGAGTYLSGTAGTCLECPKDSYCPGMPEEITFDDADHGKEPCPEGYISNAGADVATKCYKIETADCENTNPFSGHGMPIYRDLGYSCARRYQEDVDTCSQLLANACEIVKLKCESGYVQAEVNGQLDCVQEVYHCEAGTYLPANSTKCAVCPENHYCPERDYTFNAQRDQGKNVCPDELHSPVASHSESDCGRILHVGDQKLYLHSDEAHRTHPAFVVLIDGKKYYADITPVEQGEKAISPETTESLHMKIGGQEYTVHSRTYAVNGDVEMVVESVGATNSEPAEPAVNDDSGTGEAESSPSTDNNAENSGDESLGIVDESPDSANSESQD